MLRHLARLFSRLGKTFAPPSDRSRLRTLLGVTPLEDRTVPAAIPLTGPNGGAWVKVDTLTVATRTNPTAATGVQSNVVLDAGTTYLAVTSGTARIANDATGFADAEFIRYNKPNGPPQDGSSPGFAWNNHGVRLAGVDGGTTTGNLWGTYQTDHQYIREVLGQGTKVTGYYSDLPGYYGDNSGTLQVDIYAEVPVVTAAVVADAVEGEAEGVIRLTRTGDPSRALTVSYTTREGFSDLATPGTDYVQLAGAVTFQPGAATADIVITTVDDDVPEPWEFVTIDVASGNGYVIGAEATGTVRINDSDGNGVTVGVLDTAPAAEGDAPGWFRLLRGGDLGLPLTVPYTLSGTAGPSDYTVSGVPGEVTFAAGESEAFVYVSREPGLPGADGSTVTLTLTAGLEYVVTNTTGTLLLIAAPPVGDGSVTVTGKDTYFELSKAVNLNLTKSTVSVEVAGKDVPVTVTAYNSGRLGYKIYTNDRLRSPNGAAISLVATTGSEAVMNDLKWLQFATRTGTLPNNQPFTQSFRASRVSNDLRKDEVIYYADKQWVVDTPTKNSAFVGPGATRVRGTSGTGHAMAFYDAPGNYPESDFTSQTFMARTYLVYQKQILYTVQWSITVTKGPDGKLSDPVVSLDKSGPGKLDFPADVDVNADEWLWGYQDSARQKPVKIANPLK